MFVNSVNSANNNNRNNRNNSNKSESDINNNCGINKRNFTLIVIVYSGN